MPISQTRPPQPPPPPPTPPATTTDPSSLASTSTTHRRRHRHRTFSSSSSSSSSSSLSTVSSAASSPSPSPRRRVAGAATSVPFSWEHHPGIPKTTRLPSTTAAKSPSPPTPPLPLPPPPSRPRHHHHHSHPTRRRRATATINGQVPSGGEDPFAAALAECTRERADNDRRLMDSLFPSPAAVASSSSSTCVPSRRWSMASSGGVAGLLDLYGCKTAMGVAESAFVVRRPVAVVRAGHGRVGLGRAGRR
ncbi:hypothetical protein HU200_016880 [Digitaria exilis]|uniref:Uncharacterized protein n=1 Tax=Digitaria exilis TaxID=1010633 RepID=A0A835F7J4_9POAL|nr:hypothetical protein HU200_016880 [Digitaria exilis]CAB3491084.1 unnamed protein product [Digitaria exilis]